MSGGLQPYQTIAEREGLRLFPIRGDLMQPTFYRGDFALVSPVNRYEGEGVYILGPEYDPGIYRCWRRRDRVILHPDNKLYEAQEMTIADFNAEVLAIAVMKMNVMERSLMPDALRF